MAAVWLKVRMDVSVRSDADDLTEGVATAEAQEAVFNAIELAAIVGFDHARAGEVSMNLDSVEAYECDLTV